MQIEEPARQCRVRDKRDIGRLVAAVGEIDAGRGLRGAAHADQDNVSSVEVFRQLPVVAHHGEVERVDTLEIVGVEHVLRAGAWRRALSKIGLEKVEDRTEDGKAWRPRRLTALLEPARQVGVDEREENDAGRVFNFIDNPLELGRRAYKRIDVLDRGDALILRGRRSRRSDQGLSRRVGHEMEMEVAPPQPALLEDHDSPLIACSQMYGQRWKDAFPKDAAQRLDL